jgi:hypothetical protein
MLHPAFAKLGRRKFNYRLAKYSVHSLACVHATQCTSDYLNVLCIAQTFDGMWRDYYRDIVPMDCSLAVTVRRRFPKK